VRPNDIVEAYVYWASRTEACFVFYDDSRNSGYFSGCNSNMGVVPYDTNGIEFINEKQSGQALSDFGQTNWAAEDAYKASSNTYTPFTSLSYFAYIMTQNGVQGPVPPCTDSTSLLAYPENAQDGASDTVWCNWGS
jgi:hypothetical protein